MGAIGVPDFSLRGTLVLDHVRGLSLGVAVSS